LPHIPAIQLPEVTAEEEIHLRFQQWFSYYPYLPHSKDTAQVQVQVYDEGTGWSAWQDIDDWQQDRSGGWSLKSVELNEYAGLKVRVGF
jgi:hypothetical protein